MVRLLQPHTVTVLTTSACTAACRHCCMHSGPDRNETLSYPQMKKILEELLETVPELQVVVFAGGEPLLLGDDLLQAIRLCKVLGVGSRVVTNAYWATSAAAAAATVTKLREAGLDEINISSDDYHLPFISLQRVRYAWDASLAAGFRTVALANCFGTETWVTPDRLNREFGGGDLPLRFDDAGNPLDLEFERGESLVVVSNAPVQQLGRGVEGMDPSEVTPVDDFFERARDGCSCCVQSAAISPKGHLVACCGFEIEDNPVLDYGDATGEDTVSDLLDRADQDVLTNMIALVGPPRIKTLLEEHWPDEVSFKSKYHSYCEVCHDLVHDETNRKAMYRHQALFVHAILDERERREAADDPHGGAGPGAENAQGASLAHASPRPDAPA